MTTSQEWNLNIQREVVKDLSVQIGYFGSKGTHLRLSVNRNQFVIVNGVQVLVGQRPVRPFAGFSNIETVDSPGNSSYNGLWISATKRMSHRLQFSTAYSWSHSIDYNSLSSRQNFQGFLLFPQDSTNLANERGSSNFDARHHFNISYLYEFPFKGGRWIEGWKLGGSTTLQSGNPLTLISPSANATGIASVRLSLIGNPNLSNPDPALWFNKTAFCDPTDTTTQPGCSASVFGNLGRNAIMGPGFNNFDFSIIKSTQVTESLKIQIRAEFFDIFNHPNFGQPGRVRTVGPSSNFGRITSTRGLPGGNGSARQIQFGLKLIF